MSSGCSCPKCQECCRREPGWFAPHELSTAAAFLNVTEDEFVKRFCVWHDEGGRSILAPATKPWSTECVFLNRQGLCDIHVVKPYECRKVFGCKGPSRHRRIREIIARMWT